MAHANHIAFDLRSCSSSPDTVKQVRGEATVQTPKAHYAVGLSSARRFLGACNRVLHPNEAVNKSARQRREGQDTASGRMFGTELSRGPRPPSAFVTRPSSGAAG
jgi:hypothetical protein